jgi:rsbT antagonist protein RsbS
MITGNRTERAVQISVSILRQGDYLIASIHAALDDDELERFQRELITQVNEFRACGIIIDVGALDVMDSFGSRTLRNLAYMARLQGAVTVIVSIQPDVAFTMVQLGMTLENVHTALGLEEGLARLDELTGAGRLRRASRPV